MSCSVGDNVSAADNYTGGLLTMECHMTVGMTTARELVVLLLEQYATTAATMATNS